MMSLTSCPLPIDSLILSSTLQDRPNSITCTSSALPLHLCHSGVYTLAPSLSVRTLQLGFRTLYLRAVTFTCLTVDVPSRYHRQSPGGKYLLSSYGLGPLTSRRLPGNIFAILGSLLHKIQVMEPMA